MVVMTLATIGVTIPSFVVATVLMYVFSYSLKWTPTFGLDSWKSYILPVIALGDYMMIMPLSVIINSLVKIAIEDRKSVV